MPDIEIVTVRRPHSWAVKRGERDMRCATCGKLQRQTAGLVCFTEEVARVTGADDAAG